MYNKIRYFPRGFATCQRTDSTSLSCLFRIAAGNRFKRITSRTSQFNNRPRTNCEILGTTRLYNCWDYLKFSTTFLFFPLIKLIMEFRYNDVRMGCVFFKILYTYYKRKESLILIINFIITCIVIVPLM